MSLTEQFTLTAITCDPVLVRAADDAGIDRIGIDIERLGKVRRQEHIPNARISSHELDDLASVAANVVHAKIFARLNPLHEDTRNEVERAVALGARIVMLPFFNGPREVHTFVETVGGRASPILLLETAAAAARIRDIVAIRGVAEIVVGLNDLHMSLGFTNLFEVIASDVMREIASRVRDAGMRFGFGGVARVDDRNLPVPSDLIYAQYPRLGATSAWLARSFYQNLSADEIGSAVHALRKRLGYWFQQPPHILHAKRDELAIVAQELGARPI